MRYSVDRGLSMHSVIHLLNNWGLVDNVICLLNNWCQDDKDDGTRRLLEKEKNSPMAAW